MLTREEVGWGWERGGGVGGGVGGHANASSPKPFIYLLSVTVTAHWPFSETALILILCVRTSVAGWFCKQLEIPLSIKRGSTLCD